jgi:hypothetical protein
VQRTALASFPRSGNTWMRFFLEVYTGQQTGSIYEDRVMPRGRAGIVVKTHAQDRAEYTGAIHIVRDPFDAIESFFSWRRDLAGQDATWEEHVPRAARRWAAHSRHWTEAKYPVLTIRYEDMLQRPEETFASALGYLGSPVDERRLAGALEQASIESLRRRFPEVGGMFFQRGTRRQARRRFTDRQIEEVRSAGAPYLDRWGYG